jgi:hypothetical protein
MPKKYKKSKYDEVPIVLDKYAYAHILSHYPELLAYHLQRFAVVSPVTTRPATVPPAAGPPRGIQRASSVGPATVPPAAGPPRGIQRASSLDPRGQVVDLTSPFSRTASNPFTTPSAGTGASSTLSPLASSDSFGSALSATTTPPRMSSVSFTLSPLASSEIETTTFDITKIKFIPDITVAEKVQILDTYLDNDEKDANYKDLLKSYVLAIINNNLTEYLNNYTPVQYKGLNDHIKDITLDIKTYFAVNLYINSNQITDAETRIASLYTDMLTKFSTRVWDLVAPLLTVNDSKTKVEKHLYTIREAIRRQLYDILDILIERKKKLA